MISAKNPRAIQAMQLIRASGGDMRAAFYNLAAQSQYLLGQLGRFVAWTPSGTQAATAGA